MLTYPHFDPVAVNIGPLAIHWYGLMYICGFICAWILGKYRLQRQKNPIFNQEKFADLLFYAALGVIIGGRIGYVIVYDWQNFLLSPMTIFYIRQGGMSFHGGLLGVIIALFYFSKKEKLSFFAITDFIVPLVPLGLFFGRIGNFINGELWGRVTNVPWAMIFPTADWQLRHPSQLYEAFGEGLLLFTIIWFYSQKEKPVKRVSALFLITYACIRFIIEFWRQPDYQLGFIAWNWLSMGQLLCIPMIIFGITLMYFSKEKA